MLATVPFDKLYPRSLGRGYCVATSPDQSLGEPLTVPPFVPSSAARVIWAALREPVQPGSLPRRMGTRFYVELENLTRSLSKGGSAIS